jgi:Tfp pilus assembly protein PilN
MQRDVNFFSVYRSPVESENGLDLITTIGLSLIGFCVLVLIVVFAFNKIEDAATRVQMQGINSYLQSAEVLSAENTWNSYTEKSKALKEYEGKASSEVSAFKTLPLIDAGLLGAVSGAMPADVKVKILSYSGNTIVLNCSSVDKLSPANFVHTLKGTGKFDTVSYDGVTQISSTEYDFTVTCMIKGGSGR